MAIIVSKGSQTEFHSGTMISRSSAKVAAAKEVLKLEHLDKIIFMEKGTIMFEARTEILELQLISGQELPRRMLPEDEIDLMVGQHIIYQGKGVANVKFMGSTSLVIAKFKSYAAGDVMVNTESDIIYSEKAVMLTFRTFQEVSSGQVVEYNAGGIMF